MKKIMTLLVAVTLLFASCSKEKKLNRKLDGDWNVESIDGKPQSGSTISFNKDKKEGTFSITFTNGGIAVSISGRYTLTKDETITFIPTDSSYDIWVLTVTSYSKTDLTLTDNSDGEVWVLKKK